MSARKLAIVLCLLAAALGLTASSVRGEAPPPAGVLRPSLVAVSVPNLAESVRWYVDTLAFKIEKQASFPAYKLKLAILECDGFRLELVEISGSAAPGKLVPGIDNPALIQGMGKLAFTVSDLDAWAARLKSLGVRFQMMPRKDPEDGTKSFIILDNSGNWLQFTTARPEVAHPKP